MAKPFRIKISLTPLAFRILRDAAEKEGMSKSSYIEHMLRQKELQDDE